MQRNSQRIERIERMKWMKGKLAGQRSTGTGTQGSKAQRRKGAREQACKRKPTDRQFLIPGTQYQIPG